MPTTPKMRQPRNFWATLNVWLEDAVRLTSGASSIKDMYFGDYKKTELDDAANKCEVFLREYARLKGTNEMKSNLRIAVKDLIKEAISTIDPNTSSGELIQTVMYDLTNTLRIVDSYIQKSQAASNDKETAALSNAEDALGACLRTIRKIHLDFSRKSASIKDLTKTGVKVQNSTISDVEAFDLVEFGKAFASLGDAISEQVSDVLNDTSDMDLNPNAVEEALDVLGKFNVELTDYLEEWLDNYKRQNDED